MKKDERKDLDAYTQELIRQVEAEGLLQAPVHMKQEILERSRRPDYQMTVQTRKISRNMQLFFYSLKVGTAVAAALIMLFMVPRELPQVEQSVGVRPGWQQEESIGQRLNDGLGKVNQIFSRIIWSGTDRQMEE